MGYKLNVQGLSGWENLLTDVNVDITAEGNNFSGSDLMTVLEQLDSGITSAAASPYPVPATDSNVTVSSSGDNFSAGTLAQVLGYLDGGITNALALSGSIGGLTWISVAATDNIYASAGNSYIINCNDGLDVDFILPPTPSDGDEIGLFISDNTNGTWITIDGQGNTVEGIDYYLDDITANGTYFQWRWDDTWNQWSKVDSVEPNKGITWRSISSNVTSLTAKFGYGYIIDMDRVSDFTIDLLQYPRDGEIVAIKFFGTPNTGRLIITPHGEDIDGEPGLVMTEPGTAILVYNYDGGEWNNVMPATSDISGLVTLDTVQTVSNKTFVGSSYEQIPDAYLESGTYTFDYANGDMQSLNAGGDISIAFNNFPTGKVALFIIDANDWGSHTITHPFGMLFAGGVTPTYTAGGVDRLIVIKDANDRYSLSVCIADMQEEIILS